jgi:predicted transcriptional regulator
MKTILNQPTTQLPWISIQKNASCLEALKLLSHHKIHHLVITENSQPLGILTDRDIFYLWAQNTHSTLSSMSQIPVLAVMRSNMPVVKANTTLTEVVRWMKDLQVSALLSESATGRFSIITETDLLAALDKMLNRSNWKTNLLSTVESQMTSPVVQELLIWLGQMGI